MSNLIGAALSSMAFISDTNYGDWSANLTSKKALLPLRTFEIAGTRSRPSSYENPYWPGNGGMQGDQALDGPMVHAIWWDAIEMVGGCASRFAIAGISRDQFNQVLGGVTVGLFYTGLTSFALAANTLIDSTVSDPNTGYFQVTTPYYPDTHFVVLYKAGFPDVFGMSPNTLIAS